MIKKDLEKALNEQLNREFYSAYLYLSMASYLDSIGMKGAAKWMGKQAQEEVEHALKLFNYITERGWRVRLDSIDKPKDTWSSPLEVFEDALHHERLNDQGLTDLIEFVDRNGDTRTSNILGWFAKKQLGIASSLKEAIDAIKPIGESKGDLMKFDLWLGEID